MWPFKKKKIEPTKPALVTGNKQNVYVMPSGGRFYQTPLTNEEAADQLQQQYMQWLMMQELLTPNTAPDKAPEITVHDYHGDTYTDHTTQSPSDPYSSPSSDSSGSSSSSSDSSSSSSSDTSSTSTDSGGGGGW